MATVRKKSGKAKTHAVVVEKSVPVFRSREERLAAGKALRETVPRQIHAGWKPSAKRRDSVDVLEEFNRDRLPELIPIRYGAHVAQSVYFSARLRRTDGL